MTYGYKRNTIWRYIISLIAVGFVIGFGVGYWMALPETPVMQEFNVPEDSP